MFRKPSPAVSIAGLAVVALSLLLSGCGGGGPGGTPATPPTPPTTVTPPNTQLTSGSDTSPTANPTPLTATPDQVGDLSGSGCTSTPGSNLSPVFASTHPKVLLNQASTLACLRELLRTQASPATRFKAYVDQEMGAPGSTYGFAAWHAALMHQVTGEAAYADFAVAMADRLVSNEETLISAGTTPEVAHDSYLYVGEMIADVALVYDWCYPRLTPPQRSRWIAYMNQAVSNVWNPSGARWGGRSVPWSGWSVNNPSNNYYYSFLRATMLLGLATRGENTSAQGWIDQFRTTKIANELVPTFNRDLAGGGSREGTGYGVAMKQLFQLYDWWERSTGERIATLTPHAQSSQAWLLHQLVPTLDRLSAIGDQARDSSVWLFDYHREYLLSLISLFPQERLSTLSRHLLDNSTVPQMQHGFERFADYLYAPPTLPAADLSELSTTYWASGTGVLVMRASWTDKASAYSTLMCGPYTESHAHRDQGSFQLYRGEWLAPTNNIYTHSGIGQGEALNNLVRIIQGGQTINQQAGTSCQLRALADNELYTYGVAQVTPVYSGRSAVTKVEREYLFIKPDTFVVFDRVGSVAGTQRVWTLNLPGSPTINGDHLRYTGPSGHRLDVHRVAPTGLSYQVTAPEIDTWDTLLQAAAKQVNVADTTGTQTLFLHVMGTNSSVSSVSRSDSTGQTGVQINLSDGRSAVVRFQQGTNGGTLTLQASGGAVISSGALPSTVVAPPVFRH